MSNRQSIPSTDLPMGIDPFGKGLLGRNPSLCNGNRTYLGSFKFSVMIADFEVDFYLHLLDGKVMELIRVNDFCRDAELAARRPFESTRPVLEQFKKLILDVFIAGANYGGPVEMTRAGLFDHRDWRNIERRLLKAIEKKDESEFADKFGLLKLAKELDMQAEHAGGESKLFRGRCPAHVLHRIYLNPEKGNWMCGWCAINGGVDELKAFFLEKSGI